MEVTLEHRWTRTEWPSGFSGRPLATEFSPCGHQTDNRLWLRVGIAAVGVAIAIVLFALVRRAERRRSLAVPYY